MSISKTLVMHHWFHILIILMLVIFAPLVHADTKIYYVSPDGLSGGWWEDEYISAADGDLISIAEKTNGRASETEIRLLTTGDVPWKETYYYGPFPIQTSPKKKKWLTIHGPSKNSDNFVVFSGKPTKGRKTQSLKEAICGPLPNTDQRALCEKGEIDPKVNDTPALLNTIGYFTHIEEMRRKLEEDKSSVSLYSAGIQKLRINCLDIRNSSYLILKNVAFRDCWLTSVYIADTEYMEIRETTVEGSSYAFFFRGTDQKPKRVRHIKIENNRFVQSPSHYKTFVEGCDPRSNLDCSIDLWSEIPWGVTHDRFWEILNGAFIGGIDVGGDFLIKSNKFSHSYNAIRFKLSRLCKDNRCQKNAHKNFEITENEFEYIRDNPIEPEYYLDNWIISKNTFKNSHAWISLDSVRGGNVYIFGNRGWFESGLGEDRFKGAPGLNCEDSGWQNSPLFRFSYDGKREGYTLPEDIDDDFEPECHTHSGGKVLKLEATKKAKLKAIYVFNNSWYLRVPLLGVTQSSPLKHWNNAIQFAGCGDIEDPVCRIRADEKCENNDKYYFADGGLSVFAACFNFEPLDLKEPHLFDYDAFSGKVPGILRDLNLEKYAVEFKNKVAMFRNPAAGDFRPKPNSLLFNAGCNVLKKGRELICDTTAAQNVTIGAVQENGALFDIKL